MKPVVATEGGLILAGHQRSEAARALGWTEIAACIVKTEGGDHAEIRFNQIHNAGDLDCHDAQMTMAYPCPQWAEYVPAALQGGSGFNKHYALQFTCKMIAKYGQFSGCVIGNSGRVLAGQVYAMACQRLKLPILGYTLPAGVSDETALTYLRPEYGQFCYDALPRQTWMQSHAQPTRRGCSSELYRRYVLPNITKQTRVVDFGCGKGVNVRALASRGFKVWGWEPYPRRSTFVLDMAAYRAQMQQLLATVKVDGLFDVVVCDSVINSVDSKQAESDVLMSLRALCRPGGLIMLAGRLRCNSDAVLAGKRKVTTTRSRKTEFLDDYGFGAIPGKGGGWTFQLFHTIPGAQQLVGALGERLAWWSDNSYRWQAVMRRDDRPNGAEELDALRREMNLPLPDGKQRQLGDDLVIAVASAK